MFNRLTFINTAGFFLLITGGFLKTQGIEAGEFFIWFAIGFLAVSVPQSIYQFIKRKKTNQTT
ncbi:MAG: hypothetical protein JNJ75_03880 [Cyclobacteriaceae bacterium]|nr:hypothetical protein [Cyclobacteriaceae bacterium]